VAQPDGHVDGPEKEKAALDAGATVSDTLERLHVDG
jgi:hypothetical protein